MELSKSEIESLVFVLEGKTDINGLQDALKVNQPRASYLVNQLVLKGFLVKKRHGLKLEFCLATTPFAIKFREMYVAMPQRKYSDMFAGKNLDLLQVITYQPKETKIIAKILGVQPRAIRERLNELMKYALIYKTGKAYMLSPSAKEVYSFIDSIRKYLDMNGILYWRLNDEFLYSTRDEKTVHGNLTGFNEYGRFGVLIYTIKGTCFIGKTKPGIEDIFIHSLFEIEDSRTLGLAITFFLKNNLEKKLEKLKFLAAKYDVSDKLDALIQIIERYKGGEDKIEVKGIFSIEKETLERQFELYGVKI